MSEFANKRTNRSNFHWQLLATVSTIALIGAACEIGYARAADSDNDHPLVWIELGGQLSRLDDGQEAFAPTFMDARPSAFSLSQPFERPSLYSIDETGKISFQPDGSSWILSASVRYGRSGSKRHERQQTHSEPAHLHYSLSGVPHTVGAVYPSAARFADTAAQNGESHSILDFQVGRDFGLGMFGKDGSSVFNAGVRFAQFSTKTNIALKSDPDWKFAYKYGNYPSLGVTNITEVKGQPFHTNAASLIANRGFHGIGPSLSWNASAPFLGNSQAGELAFDWGLNAAILFGRQLAKVHHQATGVYHSVNAPPHYLGKVVYQPTPADREHVKSVTVPNAGGFAGLTFRVENFEMSAGYRADLFFGAMDGGIDAAKKENVGFYGPFASVSVGIGG
jgi:hypothetical protein